MPAFRVEGDATAPLRGFAFIKKDKEKIKIKKSKKYKKSKREKKHKKSIITKSVIFIKSN